jgi:hypothetical protein
MTKEIQAFTALGERIADSWGMSVDKGQEPYDTIREMDDDRRILSVLCFIATKVRMIESRLSPTMPTGDEVAQESARARRDQCWEKIDKFLKNMHPPSICRSAVYRMVSWHVNMKDWDHTPTPAQAVDKLNSMKFGPWPRRPGTKVAAAYEQWRSTLDRCMRG